MRRNQLNSVLLSLNKGFGGKRGDCALMGHITVSRNEFVCHKWGTWIEARTYGQPALSGQDGPHQGTTWPDERGGRG